jgi:histidinol dehydrogenase
MHKSISLHVCTYLYAKMHIFTYLLKILYVLRLMCVGGAQAIAAFAYGCGPIPTCDVIVGPGNKWVTAAKSLVSGICGIDMLAGPSEVLVIADNTCDPDTVAADLLAQAEHDTEARPILVCTEESIAHKVNDCMQARMALLPTAETARYAVEKGFACVCPDIETAIKVSDIVGPEHLEIITADSVGVSKQCTSYGGIFIGAISAEVLGDYGAGPNHVLPTSGTARYTGGLSVFTFLRIRTWMNITNKAEAQHLIQDCVQLARIEGLEGHAQAAECRLLKDSEKEEGSPSKRAKN